MKKKNIKLLISLSLLIIVLLIFKFLSINNYQVKELIDKNISIPLERCSFNIKEEKEGDLYILSYKSFQSAKTLNQKFEKHLENLESCYDESFYYDKDLNISINSYQAEQDGIFSKVSLRYKYANLCETEFVLDEDWIHQLDFSKFIEAEYISEAKLIKISKDQTIKLFDKILNLKRISNKKSIHINKDYKIFKVYFSDYLLTMTVDENEKLIIILNDKDDQNKNALYYLDKSNKFLEKNLNIK